MNIDGVIDSPLSLSLSLSFCLALGLGKKNNYAAQQSHSQAEKYDSGKEKSHLKMKYCKN